MFAAYRTGSSFSSWLGMYGGITSTVTWLPNWHMVRSCRQATCRHTVRVDTVCGYVHHFSCTSGSTRPRYTAVACTPRQRCLLRITGAFHVRNLTPWMASKAACISQWHELHSRSYLSSLRKPTNKSASPSMSPPAPGHVHTAAIWQARAAHHVPEGYNDGPGRVMGRQLVAQYKGHYRGAGNESTRLELQHASTVAECAFRGHRQHGHGRV